MMRKMSVLVLLTVLWMLPAPLSAGGGSQQQTGGTSQGSTVRPSGFPIVDTPITLTVFGSRDQNQAKWSDMYFFKKYAEKTNINLDLQEVPAQGFEEKKNLLFASDELPDIFLRADLRREQIAMYGTGSKQLMVLDSLLPKWAPNIRKIIQEDDAIRHEIIAADGYIYTLPELDVSDTGRMDFKEWINKE
jgi:putative aldouronate transport system substrate-binding protein